MFADSRLLLGSDAARLGNPLTEAEASSLLDHERYEVRFVLGEGAFGTVYRGWDRHLQREVALKIPKPRQGQRRDQFLQEARAAAGLRHIGLVTVHDAGVDRAGRLFAVHELIAGCPLSELAASGRLDLLHAVRLVAEAAEAIHHAHREGFVHRDLKPSNILVDSDGRARVSDFGLALSEQELRDRAGEISGSPAYMSPEQVRGDVHRLDGRTDIWSLGVILYELLTGRRPFSGRTQDEYFDEIRNREPKPIRQINDAIPRPLEHAAMKCLSKPVRERYSTAADLAADLRGWLQTNRPADSESRAPLIAPFAGMAAAITIASADPQVTTSRNRSAVPTATVKTSSLRKTLVVASVLLAIGLLAVTSKDWLPGSSSGPAHVDDRAPGKSTGSESPGPSDAPISQPQPTHGKRLLLATPPTVLVWPNAPGNSKWRFDQKEQELFVSCNGAALFALVEHGQDAFSLSVDLSQTPWTGGAGIFWGYHEIAPHENGSRRYRCEALHLMQTERSAAQVELARIALILEDSARISQRTNVSGIPVVLPRLSSAVMRIDFHRGEPTAIVFCGTKVQGLCEAGSSNGLDATKEAQPKTCGIFVEGSTAEFRHVTWTPLD